VSTTDREATWLSQEAHNRLRAELDQLIANRPVIAAEINARREEGDLKENGGYHAAREEQGKQEGRIRYLQEFLRQRPGRRGAPGRRGGRRHGGDHLFRRRQGRHRDVPCSAPEIASTTELTVYSPESALGRAIDGAHPGDTVSYTRASGAEIAVTVVAFKPFTG